MSKVAISEEYLTDIADSIREKLDTQDTYKVSEMSEAIDSIETGGGGEISINSFDDYTQYIGEVADRFENFLNSKIETYPAYTENAITLYTPDLKTSNYIIHKRSSGKYRIIWSEFDYSAVYSSTSVGFTIFTLPSYTTNLINGKPKLIKNVKDLKEINLYNGTNANVSVYGLYLTYYSNEFNSIQDLITAISTATGNITYTGYNGGVTFSSVLDSPYLIPYSNIPVIDARTTNLSLLQSQIISKNETIVKKP